MTCYVVGAAAYCAPFSPQPGDMVIAADGGTVHTAAGGIVPDCILGDFDSSKTVPIGENVQVFPVEKDDTDTLLAVKHGYALGYRRFCLLAGSGGRTDHTLANLQTLLWLARRGATGILRGEGECFTVLSQDTLSFRQTAVGRLSLFAMGGTARGVTVRGAQYELENAQLQADFPLGVSNHFTGKCTTVSVAEGALLVYWSGTPDDLAGGADDAL